MQRSPFSLSVMDVMCSWLARGVSVLGIPQLKPNPACVLNWCQSIFFFSMHAAACTCLLAGNRYFCRYQKVLEFLEMLTFPCQSRAIVKHRPRDVRLGFTLGAVRRRDCGGPLLSKWTKKLPRLTRLLANFGQLMCKLNADSSFNFTAIQVNKNNETALHVDCNNVGPSRIVGLGEYTRGRHGAGDFWVQGIPENSPGQSHSTQHSWIKFDGNVPHGTLWEPRPDETRYTLVYYTHKVCLQRDPSRLLQTLRDEYHYCVDVEKLKLQQAPDPDRFPVAWGPPRSSGNYPSRQARVDSARKAFELAGGKVADPPVNYGEDSGPDSESDADSESDEESRDPEAEPASEPSGETPGPSALRTVSSLNKMEVAALVRRLILEEFNEDAADAAAVALASQHVCGKALAKCSRADFVDFSIKGPFADHLVEKRDELVQSGVPGSLLA